MGVDRVRDIGWRKRIARDALPIHAHTLAHDCPGGPESEIRLASSSAATFSGTVQAGLGERPDASGGNPKRRKQTSAWASTPRRTRSTKPGATDWGIKGVAPEPLAFGKLAQCQDGNRCLLHVIWVVFSQHVRACGSYCAATDAPRPAWPFSRVPVSLQSVGDRCDPHLTVVIAEHQLLNAWLLSRPTERRGEYVRRSFYALAGSDEPRRGRAFRTVGYPCTQTHVYSLRYS
jgi:hypothetical protein